MADELGAIISLLSRVAPNLNGEDTADLLWLALQMPAPPPRQQADLDAATEQPERPGANATQADQGASPVPTAAAPPPFEHQAPTAPEAAATDERGPDGGGVDADGAAGLFADADEGGPGSLSFRTPAAPGLPNPLELARALRPLRLVAEDHGRLVFDEEATVRRIAEADLWVPVLRPALRAWYELALVVDGAPSLDLWRRTVEELRRLLERHNAFHDVRLWRLHVAEGQLALQADLRAGQQGAQPWPGPLRHPEGRRLVVVISDCVAAYWHNGVMARALGDLGRGTPVSILQVLPVGFWPRTALRGAPAVRVRAPAPGKLRYTPPYSPLGLPAPPGPPVPVLTLEPGVAADWAALMAGAGASGAVAYLLDRAPRAPRTAKQTASGPEDRVTAFLGVASAEARRLAALLAAAQPLNLEVARLVHSAMLPQPNQAHLAEVFLGGLLRRDPAAGAAANPDTVGYSFHPGVAEQLRATVPVADAVYVLRVVSEYIRGRLDAGDDFVAWLRAIGAGDLAADSRHRPFATVAADILAGLGDEYGAVAGRLELALGRRSAGPIFAAGVQPSTTESSADDTIEERSEDIPVALEEGDQPGYGGALISLEQVTALSPELRKKLEAYWIRSVQELVSTARASNAEHGSGRAALAVALGMSEEALRPIISAASALLPDVSFSVPVEQERGGGLFLEDYTDIDAASFAVPVSLPERVEPLFWELPPPQDQGVRNTGVAFSLAAAYQILSKDATDLSEQFLYWAVKDTDGIPGDVGADPIKAVQILQTIGICSEAAWPYRPEPSDNQNPGHGPPPPAALAEATQRRIRDFTKLPATSVNTIKAALDEGKPVLVGLLVWEHWLSSWQGSVLGRLRAPLPGEYLRGTQAMCLLGYRDDPTAPGRGYFIARNSWGPEWARENADGPGYCYVPYKLIADQGLVAIAIDGVVTFTPQAPAAIESPARPEQSEALVAQLYDAAVELRNKLVALEGDVTDGLKVSSSRMAGRLTRIATEVTALAEGLRETGFLEADAELRQDIESLTELVAQARKRTRARIISSCLARAERLVDRLGALVGKEEDGEGQAVDLLPEADRAQRPVAAPDYSTIAPAVTLDLRSSASDPEHELYPNGLSPEGKPLLRIDAERASALAQGKAGGDPKERMDLYRAKHNASNIDHL